MNRLPAFNLPRTFCAAVMWFAWLVISNHCALGDVVRCLEPAQKAASCCAPPETPANGQAPLPDSGECCRALNVLPLDPTANVVNFFTPLAGDALIWIRLEALRPAPRVEPVERLETGPPPGWSFAELVLQRSLLSHAPPTLG